MRLLRIGLLMLLAAVAFPEAQAQKKIKAVATIGMVGDLVKHVGGDRVEVESLMGPGVDPHLYKASARDVQKLQQADIIFYNGLLLEGKMSDILSRMARTKKYVYAVSESVPESRLLEPPEFDGHYDPHLWFDVELWALCSESVVKGLVELDPAGKATYEKNGAALKKKLQELHSWALAKARELPKEKRILVTSHDAYNYFGRAYEFHVVGLQGVSTVVDVGLGDIAKMVDFVKKQKVKAIFVESSVPHKTIERISKDAGVRIGGELFSDAMGEPGKIENGHDVGTYEGMIRHNLTTIVEALK